jgi:hypothetical protein
VHNFQHLVIFDFDQSTGFFREGLGEIARPIRLSAKVAAGRASDTALGGIGGILLAEWAQLPA